MPLLLNVTVLVPGVNVPPLTDQLPDTLNVPELAVNVPEDIVTFPVFTTPLEPVNAPPLIVKPPHEGSTLGITKVNALEEFQALGHELGRGGGDAVFHESGNAHLGDLA